jgi:long-chain-fatty-acid---luciferin-component ligase
MQFLDDFDPLIDSCNSEILLQRIVESVSNQYNNCLLYNAYCKKKKFFPNRDLKSLDDLAQIPYLTTASFKRFTNLTKEMLTVPEKEIMLWSMSRGTSGDMSLVGRNQKTLQKLFHALNAQYKEFINYYDYKWVLFFLPPIPKEHLEGPFPIKTGHFNFCFEQLLTKSEIEKNYAVIISDPKAFAERKRYTLDQKLLIETLQKAEKTGTPGLILGYIPGIYPALGEYFKKVGKGFKLHPDSYLITFGGWTLYNGQKVEPEKFRKEASAFIQISPNNIRDIYCFTETDVFFFECEHHRKHIPPWVEIIIRDVETLQPAALGEKGLITIYNPLAHSYAGVSILQDDVARFYLEDQCPCGRKGRTLEVFGPAH